MANNTAIEWTDITWNPVTGCTKVSPGCAHCYAEAITLRFKRGGPYLPGKTTIKLHRDRLKAPAQWRSPKKVFVNSMSDLFHDEVPFDFIDKVFSEMAIYNQHTYQILTKRPERMLEYFSQMKGNGWPSHIWAGVSAENQYWADKRIPLLVSIPAKVRFLSAEPLLKHVELKDYLTDLQWVIVGGESGPRARPMKAEWAVSLRNECLDAKVPFFFKQWGGRHNKAGGRSLEGRTWNEMPETPHTDPTKFITLKA